MLTSIRIRNFKAWRDTGPIRFAPLTVVFGANSSGKSSIGHLLLALKQTVLSADRKRALHLGDDNALIDLGTFEECIHNHQLDRSLSFQLGWTLPNRVEVKDPISKNRWTGDELSLEVKLEVTKAGQPAVSLLAYELIEDQQPQLTVRYSRTAEGRFNLESDTYRLWRKTGRAWPLDAPDKFYRISDQSRARFQNADFLADFALETEAALSRVHYLGPLREPPRRIYQWSGDTPENVGQKGELSVPALLAAEAEGRSLSRGYRHRNLVFAKFIAAWLQELGIIESFVVKPVAEGRKEFEVLVKTHSWASEVKITDVGFGVSQVLPALVQAFYSPPHSTIWMEQPEIHLHPQVQAALADVFISAIHAREQGKERKTQLIIESHSEHFLNRLQRRIAEEAVGPEEVAVYFCRPVRERAELERLRVNKYGEIENWPDNFFGDEMGDLTARTTAAMERKLRERRKEQG